MKKIILALVMIVAIGFTFTSCKNDKKDEAKSESIATEDNKEVASNEVYQCPMDCEHGKSYSKAGKCPVCNMDLKAKKAGEAGATCKCKKGEKCTCKEGECKCSNAKACGKDKAACKSKGHDKTCAKCGKDKASCKGHDKTCSKCGNAKGECTCPEHKKDTTENDGHNH